MTSTSQQKRTGTPPAVLARYELAYQAGAQAILSLEDAVVVGLYLGEGTKSLASMASSTWCITNSDLRVLKLAKSWAIRHGVSGFRVKVQIPERDPKSDAEILAHWSAALQIPPSDVRVYRKHLVQRTSPKEFGFGTVHLLARAGAARLFHLWRGQLSQFVA